MGTGWEVTPLNCGDDIILNGEKMTIKEDYRCRITPSGRWYRCKLCGKLFPRQRPQAVEMHYTRECIARKIQKGVKNVG